MISREEVRYVAQLARLELDEEEIEYFSHQLGRVIEYVKKIGELDTSHITPTSHLGKIKNPLRHDEETPSLKRDLLEGAPSIRDGYFMVPKVVE
jgi:aspartyl-tRNA(Asn)/glutamyl-tRNA(Gln) amidotransferase subunit C